MPNKEKKVTPLSPKFKEKIEELIKEAKPSHKKYISLLYEAATRDQKTNLYNNKFFETYLDIELERARRGENLSLFIIDIDFFKKINDRYGHLKADEFLIRLSKILKKQLRKPDIAARFGGEEFFILLPNTTINQAKIITSRLRDAIKKDKTLKKANVTVSGGLTQFKEGDDARKIKERADQALYKAKNTGRDKFVAME
jgi:diguanylate cyclase (GGDEF)-like protein